MKRLVITTALICGILFLAQITLGPNAAIIIICSALIACLIDIRQYFSIICKQLKDDDLMISESQIPRFKNPIPPPPRKAEDNECNGK